MPDEQEGCGSASKKRKEEDEHASVSLFREYLRINTVQPNPDYDSAVKFLKKVADDIGLDFKRIELVPGKPIALLTWVGQNPKLSSVLLNSHTDVVPVFPEHWKYPPFDAYKDDNGNIYARGSQDMKCVGIQYLEAIRRLKEEGRKLLRTIHLTFVPDEEIGGKLGMQTFVKSPEFAELNIGFALDEGLASPTDVIQVCYGERSPWWVKFHIEGSPGHGSRFLENTCAEKLRRLMNQILDFRDTEQARLEEDKSLCLGDVTSANITLLQGGVQLNVIPAEMTMGVDFRIDPHRDLKVFEKGIQRWIDHAGKDITYTFDVKDDCSDLTSISGNSPWWNAFVTACEELKIKIKPEIFPAGTDSRFLRRIGIQALGFSPMKNTPVLLHDHNEFLNEDTFMEGIEAYFHVIPTMANVPRFQEG